MIVRFEDGSGLYPINLPPRSVSPRGVECRADYRATCLLGFEQAILFERYRYRDFVRLKVRGHIDILAAMYFQFNREKIDKSLNTVTRQHPVRFCRN